ncbi:MAG: hypothetical protein EBZ81_10135 [Betaproteobacteria bacterium]|nr:hypothetical protein [Betaproteobacteria bacterium]
MNIATALMSLFEDRLNAAKSLLAPAHDRELVLAIGALFFLFPLSKTVYVLALVLAIVFSVRQANPTPWWDLIRATPLLWFPIAIYLLVLLQAPTSPADTSDVLERLFFPGFCWSRASTAGCFTRIYGGNGAHCCCDLGKNHLAQHPSGQSN